MRKLLSLKVKVLVSILVLIPLLIALEFYLFFYVGWTSKVDEQMRQEVLPYVSASNKDGESCVVQLETRSLPPIIGPQGPPPVEFSLWYAKKLVVTLVVRGFEPEAWCMRVHDHVYVFFRPNSPPNVCGDMCDQEYVSHSKDGGRLWSKLTSWDTLTGNNSVGALREGFRQRVRVLGDKNDHVIVLFDVGEEATYFLSSDLRLLKKVSQSDRLGRLGLVGRGQGFWDLLFFNGTIYFARRECMGTTGCPGEAHWIEWSKDYGRTWQRDRIPNADGVAFLTIKDTLYYFYTTRKSTPEDCSPSLPMPLQVLISIQSIFIPALGDGIVCWPLKVRKMTSDRAWTEPRTVSRTVVQLLGVFATDRGALLFWSDGRARRPRRGGFVPLLGSFAGNTTVLPRVYAGFLDLETFKIREGFIHADRSMAQLETWVPKVSVGVQPPAL